MEEVEQQQQYQEVEFKVLLDSIYETYKDKTDNKYYLSVKSKMSRFMEVAQKYYDCGSQDEVVVKLPVKKNKLNQYTRTKFYFDLVVIDSNNTVVEELFSESLEWKGLNSASKKLQTLPSNRKEARKKFSVNPENKKKL
ncbi:hypothetical protein ACTFIR_012819 [Dictyostelium discoideum]